jgi:cell division protein FtsI (penicillin-binding protein 3)
MSSKNNNHQEIRDKTNKILYLFIFLLLLLVILVISVYNSATKQRKLPTLESSKKELAVRGDIISKDNFKIASSKKLYKASIDTRYLDLDKKELFVKLFSIYSNIDETKIEQKINQSIKRGKGHVVLSYNIDSRTAKNLKELSYKLRRLNVFQALTINGNRFLTTLDIIESGEKRIYSYEDALTPVVGYISKYETKSEKTRVNGIKGLEHSYNNVLNNLSNGILKGERDVLSYISFNKDSIIKNRIDGPNVVLNIPLKLQKNIEIDLDLFKQKMQADEIIVSVMNSQTGEVIALATSNRFNPEHILQKDIPNLNVNAVEYLFEPGSIVKPITLALLIENNLIKKDELLFAYNKGKPNKKGEYPKGRYKLGRYYIKDDHQFKKNYLTPEDTIVYSSNIGILQLAQRLSAREFHEGFLKFGLTKKTGIDLSIESTGVMPPEYRLKVGEDKNEDNVYKATVSYGHGMTSTFMQILKAYTVFNNNGYMTTPQIVSHVLNQNNQIIYKPKTQQEQVLKPNVSEEIKQMLIKTVQKGTAENTKIEGLEIGGKTGTAQVAQSGSYQKKYISSFFGFANDDKNKYTIGVTVINPNAVGKRWYYLYASQSAVPVFKEVVQNLVKLNYLKIKN